MRNRITGLSEEFENGEENKLLTFHKIIKELPHDQILQALHPENRKMLFYLAFKKMDEEFLKLLLDSSPNPHERNAMIEVLAVNNYANFYDVPIHNVLVTDLLCENYTNKTSPLYTKLNNMRKFYDLAIHRKYKELTSFLKELPIEEARTLIHLDNEWLIKEAASDGAVELMEFMIQRTQSEDEKDYMLHVDNEEPFNKALGLGQFESALLIYEQTAPSKRNDLIHNENERPFKNSVSHRCWEAIRWLINIEKDKAKLSKMMHGEKDICILYAAEDGREDVIDLIWEKSTAAERKKLMHNTFPAALTMAASSGHVKFIRKIIDFVPDFLERVFIIRKIVQGDDYLSFKRAAEHGQVGVMKELIAIGDQVRGNKDKMIHANHDEACCKAAGNQHLEALLFLKEQTPDKILYKQMLRTNNGEAFKVALLRDTRNYEKYSNLSTQRLGLLISVIEVNPKVIEFFFQEDKDYFIPIAKKLYPEASEKVKGFLGGLIAKYENLHTTMNIESPAISHKQQDRADHQPSKTNNQASWEGKINHQTAKRKSTEEGNSITKAPRICPVH